MTAGTLPFDYQVRQQPKLMMGHGGGGGGGGAQRVLISTVVVVPAAACEWCRRAQGTSRDTGLCWAVELCTGMLMQDVRSVLTCCKV
jgi:hypothetical protein